MEDPAADLAVALAIASAYRDGTGGEGVAAFGEVSLTGKVRYALQGDKRIQELARRGFPRILVPARNAEEFVGSSPAGGGGAGVASGLRLEAVADVEQAVKHATTRSSSG